MTERISALPMGAQCARLCGDNFRSRVFYKLIEPADVPRFRFHYTRHTFASLLRSQDDSLHDVREQMGHEFIHTPMDADEFDGSPRWRLKGSVSMASGAGSGRIVDVGTSVRSNTGGAALAAGLLIFFGFIFLAEPAAGSGLFFAGQSLLFFALRLGGLAMVAVSGWLSFGHLPALAADAAVSIVLGAMIAIAGAFMLIDGGWWVQALIILVSGGTFLTGGLRNGRDFVDMWRIERADDKDDEDEDIAALFAAEDSPLASDLASAEAAPEAKPRPRNESELVDMEPPSRPKDARTGGADQAGRIRRSSLTVFRPDPLPGRVPVHPPAHLIVVWRSWPKRTNPRIGSL